MRGAALILLSLSLGVAVPADAASLLPLNVQVGSSFLQILEGDLASPKTLIAGPSTNGSITWTDSAGGSGTMSVSGGNALDIDFVGTRGSGVGGISCGSCTVDLDFTVPDLGGPTTTVLLLPTFSATAPDGVIVAGGPSDTYSSALAGASISISLETGGDYSDASSVMTSVAPGTLATFIAGDRITLPLDIHTFYRSYVSSARDFTSSFGLKVYAVVPEPGSLPLLLAAGIAVFGIRRRASGAAYSSATPRRSV